MAAMKVARVPAGPILSTMDLLEEPQFVARWALGSRDQGRAGHAPGIGPLSLCRPPARLGSANRLTLAPLPTPRRGMFERAAPPAKAKVALDAAGAGPSGSVGSGSSSGGGGGGGGDVRRGEVVMPAILPVMAGTPGRTRWAGAPLGHHTEEVLRGELGLAEEELARLRGLGAIA
jgi:crotonobetainyl-CoA:carnitine CoA-transferase CaiB-like acyl-CoA transferase